MKRLIALGAFIVAASVCAEVSAAPIGAYGLIEGGGEISYPVRNGSGEYGAQGALEAGISLLRVLQIGGRLELGVIHENIDHGSPGVWGTISLEVRVVFRLLRHLGLGFGASIGGGYWNNCYGDVCGTLGPAAAVDARIYVPLVPHFGLEVGLQAEYQGILINGQKGSVAPRLFAGLAFD